VAWKKNINDIISYQYITFSKIIPNFFPIFSKFSQFFPIFPNFFPICFPYFPRSAESHRVSKKFCGAEDTMANMVTSSEYCGLEKNINISLFPNFSHFSPIFPKIFQISLNFFINFPNFVEDETASDTIVNMTNIIAPGQSNRIAFLKVLWRGRHNSQYGYFLRILWPGKKYQYITFSNFFPIFSSNFFPIFPKFFPNFFQISPNFF
jgi:hypothetical protein